MRVVVDYQDDGLEFELPGSNGSPPGTARAALDSSRSCGLPRGAEDPRDYPPLRQMLVPGDRSSWPSIQHSAARDWSLMPSVRCSIGQGSGRGA